MAGVRDGGTSHEPQQAHGPNNGHCMFVFVEKDVKTALMVFLSVAGVRECGAADDAGLPLPLLRDLAQVLPPSRVSNTLDECPTHFTSVQHTCLVLTLSVTCNLKQER